MKKLLFISLMVFSSVGYLSAADTEMTATAEELTAEELKDLAAQMQAVKFRDSRKAARTVGRHLSPPRPVRDARTVGTRLAPPASKRTAKASRRVVRGSRAAVDLFPANFGTAGMADALAGIDSGDQGAGAGQEDAGASAMPAPAVIDPKIQALFQYGLGNPGEQ